MSWEALGSFVSTPAGKDVWNRASGEEGVEIVITGLTNADEMAKTLCRLIQGIVPNGNVRVLKGGWAAVMGSSEAGSLLVTGENDRLPAPSTDNEVSILDGDMSPPRTAPVSHAPLPPPIPPSQHAHPALSHHPSLPSLRTHSARSRRNLPSLTIKPGQSSSTRRPPKLSLNLDKPMRSATAPSFPQSPTPHAGRNAISSVQSNTPQWLGQATGGDDAAPRSASPASIQMLCHSQSKLPPSPSSFRDINEPLRSGGPSLQAGASTWTQGSDPSSTATAKLNGFDIPTIYPTPATPDGNLTTASTSMPTARNISPFSVSSILPGFLYLGSEVASPSDVKTLQKLGVKRILNVAIECDDDEGLNLRETFDRYYRIPMKDIVEESGVARGLREACDFLGELPWLSNHVLSS